MDEIEEIKKRNYQNYPGPERDLEMRADILILLKRVEELETRLDTDVQNERIEQLESDLKLNASLAREAEAKADGWEEFAAQTQRNIDYYVSLLDEISKNFGKESYTSDDGSIQDSPLRAKIPELVKNSVDSLTKLKDAVKRHKQHHVTIISEMHLSLEMLKMIRDNNLELYYKVLDELK